MTEICDNSMIHMFHEFLSYLSLLVTYYSILPVCVGYKILSSYKIMSIMDEAHRLLLQ